MSKFHTASLSIIINGNVSEILGEAFKDTGNGWCEVDTKHPKYISAIQSKIKTQKLADPAKAEAMRRMREAGSNSKPCCGQ